MLRFTKPLRTIMDACGPDHIVNCNHDGESTIYAQQNLRWMCRHTAATHKATRPTRNRSETLATASVSVPDIHTSRDLSSRPKALDQECKNRPYGYVIEIYLAGVDLVDTLGTTSSILQIYPLSSERVLTPNILHVEDAVRWEAMESLIQRTGILTNYEDARICGRMIL